MPMNASSGPLSRVSFLSLRLDFPRELEPFLLDAAEMQGYPIHFYVLGIAARAPAGDQLAELLGEPALSVGIILPPSVTHSPA